MRRLKWSVLLAFALLIGGFFHYVLPQHDVVRIVGTSVQRMDLGTNAWFFAAPDAGNAQVPGGTREVKFIETFLADGRPMVFRNEDTGWGWPPYFKMNSFDVQTRATDLTSTEAAPRWVMVTHYGWRNQFMTIFPNALRLKLVASPDVRVFPWFNILFFIALGVALLALRRAWLRFRADTVEPMIDEAEAAWDRADAAQDRARGALARWWRRLLGRSG